MTTHESRSTQYRAVYETTWSRKEFEAGKIKSPDLFGPLASSPEIALEELYHYSEGTAVSKRIERRIVLVLETNWEEVH